MEKVNKLSFTSSNWKLPFFTIWSGQSISLLGSQLVQFGLIWWLTQTTGSATVLATASLMGLLPQVLIGPFAGTWVDRSNRRLVMIAADSTSAMATLGLVVLFWSGSIQIWHVYLAMLIRAIAGGFHWSAMQASTSLMVPDQHLARVQGLNQMLNGGMNIASAPLGALLLELLPMQGVLSIDVFTAFFAIVPLLFIAIPQPKSSNLESMAQKPSFWEDFRAGWKYAFGWPGLVMIGLMAILINMLLTPAASLNPLLVSKHFNGQAVQLAWMESAWGIGMILGGLLLSIWGGFRRRIYTSLVGLLFLGFSSMVLGFTPAGWFPLAVLCMFFLGAANPIVNGPLFAVLQKVVAPEMQGRVFTLIGSFASAMAPIGLIIAGPVADRLGIQTWYVAGGVVTLLVGLGAFFVPAIVHLEDQSAALSDPTQLAPSPIPVHASSD